MKTDALGVCEWCGQPAVTRILTHPPVIRTVKGVKTVVKTGVYADVCGAHRHPYRKNAPETDAMIRREYRRQMARHQMTLDDVLPVQETP